MTAHDISEEMAFDRLQPWGEEREDLRAGMVASTIANCHKKKGGKSFSPTDFVLRFGPPEERGQTEEQMIRMARALNKLFGGEERERGDDRQPSGQDNSQHGAVQQGDSNR